MIFSSTTPTTKVRKQPTRKDLEDSTEPKSNRDLEGELGLEFELYSSR